MGLLSESNSQVPACHTSPRFPIHLQGNESTERLALRDDLSPVRAVLYESQKSREKAFRAKEVKLLTWNARSLSAEWRWRELSESLAEGDIFHAVALQETRWTEAPDISGYTVVIAPAVGGQGGLALMARSGFELVDVRVGRRMLAAVVAGRGGQALHLVTAHAPHGGRDDEEVRSWWAEFREFYAESVVISAARAHPTPTIALGDFNARMRGEQGMFLPQEENEGSRQCAAFAAEHRLFCANVAFSKPEGKLVTFEGGGRRAQLDVILVEQRWRSSVLDAQSIDQPTPSDHRPLEMRFRARLLKTRAVKTADKPSSADWSYLVDADIRAKFVGEVLVNMAGPTRPVYRDFVEAVAIAEVSIPRAEPFVPPKVVRGKAGRADHRATLTDLATKHFFAERSHRADINEEVQFVVGQFEKTVHNEPAKAWKFISHLGAARARNSTKPGSASSAEEIRQHFENVNGKPRGTPDHDFHFARRIAPEVDAGDFRAEELEEALRTLRTNCAVGADKVPAEVLKMEEFGPILLWFANAYLSGTSTPDFLMTILVMLPKKGSPAKVANCRGIALISCFLKVVNRMLLNRLRVLEPALGPWQAGFRPFRGTAEQVAALKCLIDRHAADPIAKLVLLFVDFSKAFDSINENAIRQALAAFGVPARITEAALAAYKDHRVRVRGAPGAEYSLQSGVLQGDTLAPYIFVLVLDALLYATLLPEDALKIGGRTARAAASDDDDDDDDNDHDHNNINTYNNDAEYNSNNNINNSSSSRGRSSSGNTQPPTNTESSGMRLRPRRLPPKPPPFHDSIPYLGYADDLCITCGSAAAAERQLHRLQRLARHAGLELNFGPGKTEYVYLPARCHARQPWRPPEHLDNPSIMSIDRVALHRGTAYRYLGAEPLDVDGQFSKRLQLAWYVAHRLRRVWECKAVQRALKRRLLECLVRSIFFYGSVIWPTTAQWRRRVDAAYSRLLRFCLGKSEDMRMQYDNGRIPHASALVAESRLALVGHTLRRDTALRHIILHPAPEGVRGHKLTFERQLAVDMHLPFGDRTQWTDLAESRLGWRQRARHAAAVIEDEAYVHHALARRRRWESIARLSNRVYLLIAEVLAEGAIVTDSPGPAKRRRRIRQLRPFSHRERVNTFRRSASVKRKERRPPELAT